MKPFISICIPAFNKPDLIKRALDSIAIQTFTNYEIVITDDSDTNEVKKLINSYSSIKILYFKNHEPLGSPLNWNMAMSKASGYYIKILHHDDYFTHEKSLEIFVEAATKNPNANFLFCYTQIYFKKNHSRFIHKQTQRQINKLKNDSNFLFFKNIIGAPSVTLFKNDTTLFFNPNYKWLVDVEFYIQYLKKYPLFINIEQPLITVVDGEEGQITQDITKQKIHIISENILLFSTLFNDTNFTKKSVLYFEEIFEKWKISNEKELKEIIKFPNTLNNFISKVFIEKNKNVFLKKIIKRLLTSRYNKQFLKIERF